MIALETYEACFGDHLINPVYVDYDRDTLFFVRSNGLASFFRNGQNELNSRAERKAMMASSKFEELKRVRFIALQLCTINPNYSTNLQGTFRLSSIPSTS